jgi:hypothetical protein
MSPDIYDKCSKEADRVYRYLTSGKRHLKKNCKRKPPYDWSDIVEKSKDEAMKEIASRGDADTACFWELAEPTDKCPNWIAQWFLYHKFRYRDGRNRNPQRDEHGRHHSSGISSRYPDSQATEYWRGSENVSNGEAMSSSSVDGYGYGGGSAATSSTSNYPYQTSYQAPYQGIYQGGYQMSQSYPATTNTHTPNDEDSEQAKPYYDPIRDRRVGVPRTTE